MKRLLYLIFVLSNISLYSMEPNYHVIITTADQQEYTLPRWKVRESNTLYTTFLEKLQECPDILPVCITAPTISHDELHAYSTALDQKNFDNYYKYTLTPDQQRILTNAVGQHVRDNNDELIPKLCDTAMSMKILSLMLDKAIAADEQMLHNIGPEPQAPICCILDHFKRSAIISNASQKNYEFTEYTGDVGLCRYPDGSRYNIIPSNFKSNKGTSNFNGFSPNIPYTFADNTQWRLKNVFYLNNSTSYILTPAEQSGTPSPNNMQKLWFYDHDTETKTLLKEICHINDIKTTMFSKNGKYLAITSHHQNKQGKLSLISLELEDNKLKNNAETNLPEHSGWIDALCFNNQETILAAGISSRILFWNTQTLKCLFSEFGDIYKNQKYLATPGDVMLLCFNHDDSRLAVATWNYDESDKTNQWHTFTLYDTSDINNIALINSVNLEDSSPSIMRFDPDGDKLIIGTDNRAFVIDGWTGKEIMATEKISYEYQAEEIHSVTPSLLFPLNILAVCAGGTRVDCNKAQLWDIDSKQLLTTLIENQPHLTGIGSSPNCRAIFIIYLDGKIIQTDLCDESVYAKTHSALKNLDIFQLYCLRRTDKEYVKPRSRVDIHRQSLLYKGIKSIPQNVKDVMYNIFHMLHAYGSQNNN